VFPLNEKFGCAKTSVFETKKRKWMGQCLDQGKKNINNEKEIIKICE